MPSAGKAQAAVVCCSFSPMYFSLVLSEDFVMLFPNEKHLQGSSPIKDFHPFSLVDEAGAFKILETIARLN